MKSPSDGWYAASKAPPTICCRAKSIAPPSHRSSEATSSLPALRRMKSPVAGSFPKQPICGGAAGAAFFFRQNMLGSRGSGVVIHEPLGQRKGTLPLPALAEAIPDARWAVRRPEEARRERVIALRRTDLHRHRHRRRRHLPGHLEDLIVVLR